MNLKLNLLISLLLLFSLCTRAESHQERVTIDNMAYYVFEDDTDAFAILELAISDLPKNLIIPDSIKTNGISLRVRGVLDAADSYTTDWNNYYENYSRVVTIHIPKHVEYIESEYLSDVYMDHLESITVDPDNQTYRSENGMLIARENEVLEVCPIPHTNFALSIPEGVKEVANSINFSNVTSIYIPASLTNLNFLNSRNLGRLNSITVSEGNTYFRSEQNGFLIEKDNNKLIAYPNAWTGRLQIPQGVEIIETNINYGITEIFIPQSVKSISSFGSSAFNLTNIEVEESNPYFKSVDGALFSKDGKTLFVFPLANKEIVEIGDGVKEIKDYAFIESNAHCKVCFTTSTPPLITNNIGIDCLYIPSEKMDIYKSAYGGIYYGNLLSYDLLLDHLIYSRTSSGTAEVIGFYGTDNDLVIPKSVNIGGEDISVTKIRNQAIKLSQFQNVILPEGLFEIGDSAFFNSTISMLSLPSTISKIGDYAFHYCYLSKIHINGMSPISISPNCFSNFDTELILQGEHAGEFQTAEVWRDFVNQKSMDIVIDGFAYTILENEKVELQRCLTIREKMIIPDVITIESGTYKVTSIGNLAFSPSDINFYDYGLKQIKLPQYLETIGDSAFFRTGLTTVTIPSGVRYIGKRAFYIPELTNIIFDNTTILSNIGENAFYQYNDNTSIIALPASLKETNPYIKTLDKYKKVIWADLVDGGFAYKNVSNGLEITKCLETSEEISIPDIISVNGQDYYITSIGALAFSKGSYIINKIILPQHLENVNDSAFFQIPIKEITIPASVKSIGNYAFYTYELRNVKMRSKEPPTAYQQSFIHNVDIFVSPDAVEVYKNTYPWSQFNIVSSDVVIDNVSYVIISETEVQVTSIICSSYDEIREIPSTIEIDGKNYTVTSTSENAFSNSFGRILILPTTINNIENPYFGSYSKVYIQSIQVPSISKVMQGYGSSNDFLFPRNLETNYKSDNNWKQYAENWNTQYVDGRTEDVIYRTDDNEITICAWLRRIDATDEFSVDIPAEINGIPVTTIAQNVLYNLSINTIHLPSTIKYIGANNLYINSNGYILCDAIEAPIIGYHYSNQQRLYVKPAAYNSYMIAIDNGSDWKNFDIIAVDGVDDDFLYTLNSDCSGVILVNLRKSQADYGGEVAIPNMVSIDNKEYKVLEIGPNVFYGCWDIYDIHLPKYIMKIGENTFTNCGLSEITFPATLKEIGKDAFFGTYLRNIIIETGNESFTTDGKYLMTKDLKRLILYYGNNDAICEIPNGVETVDEHAFSRLYRSDKLIIPATVKNIPINAFNTSDINEIYVDKNNNLYKSEDGILYDANMTTILYYPNKDYIDQFALPETVITIGEYALGCAKIGKLTLPKSLQTICNDAFIHNYQSAQISEIIIQSKQAPEIEWDSFDYGLYNNTTLMVPVGQVDLYKNHYIWSNFANIISSGISEEEIAEEDYLILKQFYSAMNNGAGWTNKWELGETYSEAHNLPGILFEKTHVVSIDLSDNGITGTLSDIIFNLPYLKEMKLDNNQLECTIGEIFSSEVSYIAPLEALNLSHNLISGNLGDINNKLPHLISLDVSYNKISDVYPMLPTSISLLKYHNQDIDKVYKFSNMLNVYPTEHMTEMPTIIYYRHDKQYYDMQLFQLRTIDSTESWQIDMYLSSLNLFATVPYNADKLYKLPSGNIFKLYTTGNDNGHTAFVELDYEMGDVNFDAKVNVGDLQATINYAIKENTNDLFNFAAADIQNDNWVNVQDVISLINILIERDFTINLRAETRSEDFETTTEEDLYNAHLFCDNKRLVLNTEKDVAAMEIVVKASTDFKWLFDDTKFSYRIKDKNGYFRIIVYSLDGNCIKPGEIILASALSSGMDIISAELVDIDAHHIPLAIGHTTSIEHQPTDTSLVLQANQNGMHVTLSHPVQQLRWWIYSIGGQLIATGNMSNLSAGTYQLECNKNSASQVVIKLEADGNSVSRKMFVAK